MSGPAKSRMILLKAKRHKPAKERVSKPSSLSVEDLREMLQYAIELEHSTIPPYLCALYSIHPSKNQEAAQIIQSVVMEEMLHMIQSCNLLNAIGGSPAIDKCDFIPDYPTGLPLLDSKLVINLAAFSPQTVQTFIDVESPKPVTAPNPRFSKFGDFRTIGQFYEAIRDGICSLAAEKKLTFREDNQVTPDYFYGGDGILHVVKCEESANMAIDEIVWQGEGAGGSIDANPPGFEDEIVEPAHYYRYIEIRDGRKYAAGDKPEDPPSGERFDVDWDAVYPMQQNPKVKNYKPGSELQIKADAFNKTYSNLLRVLHHATNGKPKRMLDSIPLMYELKYQAIELMKIPVGNGTHTAGPSFEYVKPV